MGLRFRAIVFDMDGTLFGTEQVAIDALQAVFGEYGVEVPQHALESVIGRAEKETREVLSQFAPREVAIDEILQRGGARVRARIEREGMPIKPGVIELLDYLRQRRVAIGLATSTRSSVALENIRRAKIAGYFDTVVCGDQVENAKPRPDVYLQALRELGVAAADAFAVEDSDLGIRAASAAGLRVIYVPDIKRIDAETKALVYREYASLHALREDLASTS